MLREKKKLSRFGEKEIPLKIKWSIPYIIYTNSMSTDYACCELYLIQLYVIKVVSEKKRTNSITYVISGVYTFVLRSYLLPPLYLDTAGSTYVRWGRKSCPNNTELVYSGKCWIKLNNDEWKKPNILILCEHKFLNPGVVTRIDNLSVFCVLKFEVCQRSWSCYGWLYIVKHIWLTLFETSIIFVFSIRCSDKYKKRSFFVWLYRKVKITTGVTSGLRITYPARVPEFIPGF